jgi:hypothetical protein
MKTFFDLQNLDEISEEQLVADVKQSKCLVTILDTETFRSPWVVCSRRRLRTRRWSTMASASSSSLTVTSTPGMTSPSGSQGLPAGFQDPGS